MKYVTKIISKNCKFYELNDLEGRLATIEFHASSFMKYRVSFSYRRVEDNLEKSKSFRTLKEAKAYVAEVLEHCLVPSFDEVMANIDKAMNFAFV